MKKNVKFSVLTALGMFLLAGTLFVLSGCGGSSTPTTTAAASTTATVTGTVTSSAKYKDFTGYKIYAQAKKTHKMFYTKVNADGSFSLALDSANSYIMTLVNDKSRVEAVFVITNGTDTLITGFKILGSGSLGTFTLDTANGKVLSSSAKLIGGVCEADTTLTARAKSGKPVGMGNLGKGTDAKLPAKMKTDEESPDQDSDGLTDSYDADADGDGTVDELQSGTLATTKSGKSSACISSVGLFMNLKIAYDKTNSINTNTDMVITLELIPKDATCAADISKVEVLNGPTYLKTATVAPSANGWTDNKIPSAYPTVGTLWKDVSSGSYDMFNLTPPSETIGRWTIWIVANDAVTAGDSFHFKVTYKSSSEEQFVKMIDYVFVNIPILSTYNGTTAPTPSSGGSGTSANPVSVGSGDLTLVFTRPKDETGAEITGMKYKFEIFYRDSSGAQLGSARCTASEFTDSGSGTTLTTTIPISGTTCLPTTSGSSAVSSYQIDLTASSTAGDNSAQLFYVKK